ncbi:MAG TPA: RusA family crossover junction endodeoxyribonuclease [Stellaceae bacterium]|nr:RusA family crossover junction endodeoxyribonuclease [Stellaceae bacterium]
MVFEFAVSGVPRTAGALSVGKWQSSIRAAADAVWPYLQPAIETDISITIVYFHFGDTSIDVDNMSKPILDALKPTYIRDDRFVAQLVARRTRLAPGLILTSPGTVLLGAIDAAKEKGTDFVYIKISDPPDHGQIP